MQKKITASMIIAIILALLGILTGCKTMSYSTNKPVESKKTKSALLNTQLGITYLQHHQVQLAKQKLLLALNEDPTIPEPWYAMAFYLEVTGDNFPFLLKMVKPTIITVLIYVERETITVLFRNSWKRLRIPII
jgi:hypothetical protein